VDKSGKEETMSVIRNKSFSAPAETRTPDKTNVAVVDLGSVKNAESKRFCCFVYFVVLGATLYVSCMLLSVELGGSLFFHLLAYSTILLALMRLSKRAIADYCKSIGEWTYQTLGNAIGILIGSCIMLLLEKLFSNHSNIVSVLIISGVISFFVLGTLCPLVHKSSVVHE
jgi:hypothetical protein